MKIEFLISTDTTKCGRGYYQDLDVPFDCENEISAGNRISFFVRGEETTGIIESVTIKRFEDKLTYDIFVKVDVEDEDE